MNSLTSANIDEITSTGVTMIDFWAPWCGPCRMIAPIMEQLNEEYVDGKVKIFKVNVDENADLATKFGIRGVPTVLIFKDGQVVETMVGANTKSEYVNKLDSFI